uniref:VWFA domain-containing protein n=1 Tax=Capra hircus TaxID=9925 RepID=A0A8C2R5S2_CAPHI
MVALWASLTVLPTFPYSSGLASYHGFNLDVEEPLVFREDIASFGQSVVQFNRSRLVVGAPLEVVTVNKTGRLYDCMPATRQCQPISLNTPSEAVDMSLGLSLAASTHLSQLLACGPTVHKACGDNMYIKGTCLLLGSHLQVIRTIPTALPECPNQEMDIAFLIDGSGSIDQTDFKRMKNFVRAVMDLFKRTNTQFSLMQYSNLMKTHFTFNQFRTIRSSRSLVDPIAQLNGLTFTATGILRVVRELFHSKNGARKSARKIIIVITDGEKFKDPLKYTDVIPEVGDAFQAPAARQELNIIGSMPSEDHVFKVDNFAALSSILKRLQEKIFAVEGTQSGTSSSFQHEMSQEGFSSILTMVGGACLEISREKLLQVEETAGAKVLRQEWGSYARVREGPAQPEPGELGAAWRESWRAEKDQTMKTREVTIKLGISSSHSQRIAGSQLSLGLQYFGRSLSGGQDLTQDGLVDLAVGARGHALLLRTLPVLKVNMTMKFTPLEVTKAVYQCWDELTTTVEAGQATVCLTIHKSSQDHLGDVQSSVTYDLALDPGRLISRAVFDETKNWTLTRRKTLGLGEHCDSMKLLLPECVEDIVNPIILRLNFSLVGEPIASSQNLRPVLAVGSQDLFTASLPFEKNCGQDHLCEGDLSVSLSFSGLETLVVGSSLELNVTVMVSNEGEDSYGTVISFYYPAGLSYRRTLAIQQPGQRPLRLACEAVPTGNEGLKSSSCSINHPIFREGIMGTFIVTFDVSYKATLGDKFHLRANISSENNKPTSNKTTSQLELPVKYAVYTVISRQEESTKYFNFSASDQKSRKEAEHRYRVNNLSQRELAISVHFWVPVLLNGVVVWDVALVAPSQSLPCVSEREPPQQPDFQTQMPSSLVLDCSIADCLRFRCDIPSFGVQEELDFILKGNLSFGWASQLLQKKTLVVSMAEVTFNRSVYTQISGQEAFLKAQVMTFPSVSASSYSQLPILPSYPDFLIYFPSYEAPDPLLSE